MEYTKDMIFQVSYGQAERKERFQFLKRLTQKVKKHKFMAITIGMTSLLILLDFMLIASFIQVLSTM